MRYKFYLDPNVKSTVEWELSSYKDNKRQLDQAKAEMIPSTVQHYSLTAGVDGGDSGRTTEDIAFKLMSAPYIRRLEISIDSIERAFKFFDDIDMKLIELVFWRKGFTAEGAGIRVGLQKTAVYQRLNKILGMIALEMGYISK